MVECDACPWGMVTLECTDLLEGVMLKEKTIIRPFCMSTEL